MELYLAGEHVFTGERKLDIGIIRNRLLSFDYQKKVCRYHNRLER